MKEKFMKGSVIAESPSMKEKFMIGFVIAEIPS
jgi:hypothetical protein